MSEIVALFDPSLGSMNKGDEIIADAVNAQLNEMFPKAEILRISVHQPLGRKQRKALNDAKLKIVGGSNILCPVMHPVYRQNRWNLSLYDYRSVSPFVYMGVGRIGHKKSNQLGRYFLRKYANHAVNVLHSFRDEASVKYAAKFGLYNTINTGCPTLWGLGGTVNTGPSEPKKMAVATLTAAQADNAADSQILKKMVDVYDEVYFWGQGLNDTAYLHSLHVPNVKIVHGEVKEFTEFLKTNRHDLDYIGTRLHGGIRALQMGVRSIILAIDNRANDMAESFNLPVVDRHAIESLEDIFIHAERNINVPEADIVRWKKSLVHWHHQ